MVRTSVGAAGLLHGRGAFKLFLALSPDGGHSGVASASVQSGRPSSEPIRADRHLGKCLCFRNRWMKAWATCVILQPRGIRETVWEDTAAACTLLYTSSTVPSLGSPVTTPHPHPRFTSAKWRGTVNCGHSSVSGVIPDRCIAPRHGPVR